MSLAARCPLGSEGNTMEANNEKMNASWELESLLESLQLHLLELYELHYLMITFGKVFHTKTKRNCNAYPMRGECKHFASAFASARIALPGPEEKHIVTSRNSSAFENDSLPAFSSILKPQLEGNRLTQGSVRNNCQPIIEEPIQEDDMSKALVAVTADVASIAMPKLKNISRLRTEHQVYELPDSHPLLEGIDKRVPNDPCPYLLAIWTPGETAQSTEPPQSCCNSQDSAKLCDKKTCFQCNSIKEAQAQTVKGTLLIPCRTTMRGSFPLDGTYFQVNEVFADHSSSDMPIDVPRGWIWNLPRRTVFFGTSISTIFEGLTTEGIQHCFGRGFVCVQGFERSSRTPKPLCARLLHFSPSRAVKNKKAPE